jgi:hypothetical protein
MRAKRCISVFTALLCPVMLAAVAAAGSPPAGSSRSIIDNGGFEQWEAAPGDLRKSMDCPQLPARWSVLPRDDRKSYSVHRDAVCKHGGSFSVRLGNTATKGNLSLVQRTGAEPEYRYVVRLWLKGDHIDAYHPLGVIVHVVASSQSDKHDTGLWSGMLRHSDRTDPPNSGTFDWREFVCTFDTPVDTRSILVLVELRGAGVAWVDDVSVRRLEKCKQVESY